MRVLFYKLVLEAVYQMIVFHDRRFNFHDRKFKKLAARYKELSKKMRKAVKESEGEHENTVL